MWDENDDIEMSGHEHPEKRKLYDFIAAQRFAVVATISASGVPEAALVGIAVTPDLELIFETTDATRKHGNLRRDPHISLVIGWADQRTLQYEGVADEPMGTELERLKTTFFSTWPELRGHEGWPGLTYFRVKPRWIRFSSYYQPRSVEEIIFAANDAPSETTSGFFGRLRDLVGGR